jgi:predicted secreted protein
MKKIYFLTIGLFLTLLASAQTIDSTLDFSAVDDTLMLQAIDVARTASAIADPLLSFPNPFQGETFDTAIISMDVFNYGDLHVLGALFSFFDAGLGRMYFTNGSYLGYNGVGGWYDANLLNYGIDEDFLGNNMWKNVELMFTPTEFAMFVDGSLAFADTSTNVTMGGEASTGGAFADHDSVLYFLQNAASFVIGTGSWWSDNINPATGIHWDIQYSYIKNINLIAIQSAVADTTPIDHMAVDYAFKPQAVDVAACASSDAAPTLSYDNPLKGLDFSAADISFDVYTYYPDSIKVLGSLVSVFDTGDAGRMYFTNGSYLGYNGLGGYYDANLLNYGVDSSFITPGSWKNVKLHFDAAGFAVYIDNEMAFDKNSTHVTIAGTLTDHTNVIEFLQTASTIMIGTGSWWSSNTRPADGSYYDAQFSYLRNLTFMTTEYPKEIFSGGNMEDSTAWITYWRADNADTGSFAFNYTDDLPAAGDGGCLKINAFGNSGAFAKQAVTITPGHAYKMSGAFKNISTDAITNSWVELIFTRKQPEWQKEFGAGDAYVIYEKNTWMSDPIFKDMDIDGTFEDDFNYKANSFDAPFTQNFVIADTVTQTEWWVLIKAGSSNGDGVATPDINYLFDEISLMDLGIDTESPTDPSNLAADGSTLTWDASTDNIGVFHYVLYDGETMIASIAAKETDNTYTFAGLTEGTHTLGVMATDQSGNESDMVTVDTEIVISVEDNKLDYFTLYPNPTTGIVNILTNSSAIATLEVYNMTGKLIMTTDFTKDYRLDLTDVNSGLYFIYLKTEDGVQVEKLILQ